MNLTRAWMQRLLQDESGQDLVEYALVAALLGLGAVAALKSVASSVASVFTALSGTLTTAV